MLNRNGGFDYYYNQYVNQVVSMGCSSPFFSVKHVLLKVNHLYIDIVHAVIYYDLIKVFK